MNATNKRAGTIPYHPYQMILFPLGISHLPWSPLQKAGLPASPTIWREWGCMHKASSFADRPCLALKCAHFTFIFDRQNQRSHWFILETATGRAKERRSQRKTTSRLAEIIRHLDESADNPALCFFFRDLCAPRCELLFSGSFIFTRRNRPYRLALGISHFLTSPPQVTPSGVPGRCGELGCVQYSFA